MRVGEGAINKVNGFLRAMFVGFLGATFFVWMLPWITTLVGGVNVGWMMFFSPGFYAFVFVMIAMIWILTKLSNLVIEDTKTNR